MNSQIVYKALLRSDYQKVAANFDRPQKIKFEIIQLFSHVSQNADLATCIFEELAAHAGQINMGCDPAGKPGELCSDKWQSGSISNLMNLQSDALHEFAEDIFYEVGMNAESDANQYAQTQSPFDFTKPDMDFIRFEQYLRIMQRHGVGEIPSVGCVLNLMDSGLLSMNLDLSDSWDSVQCILKAGELSTFVLPRRFSVLIPALSIVEQNYEKADSSIKNVVIQFIEYLQDHCYLENGEVSKEDVVLLRKLFSSFPSPMDKIITYRSVTPALLVYIRLGVAVIFFGSIQLFFHLDRASRLVNLYRLPNASSASSCAFYIYHIFLRDAFQDND